MKLKDGWSDMQSDGTDCVADKLVEWFELRWRSIIYSFIAGIVFTVVCTFCSAAHAAGYAKPAGAPTVVVPNYGVEVGVWAAQTAVGHGIGVFEKSGNGDWTLCFNCLASVEYPTLDAVVSAAGGAGPYVAGQVNAINAILQSRYPSIVSEPTATLDKVNASVGTYRLGLVNGSPQFGK